MPHYVRAVVPGGTFFFTVALLERHRRLLVENIEALRDAFCTVRRARSFAIEAIVILPDRLHCIWTLPPGDADFSTRWRLIKSAFARRIPVGERLSSRRRRAGERGVWQRRFWEHAIRDEADFGRYVAHPLQSGETRPCSLPCRLAVLVIPELCSARHLPIRLGGGTRGA